MAELLDDDEIESQAPEEWDHEGEEILRGYEFEEYLEGVSFSSDVAELADEGVHHPEIRITYDEVEVRFTSHEEGGVTDQDVEMAERVEETYDDY